MKLLLSRGANLKLRDENGLNCLHAGLFSFYLFFYLYINIYSFILLACQNSHFDIVQWLVLK